MADSTFLLSILLKLKDDASKGVDNFVQKLASLDKQSTKTLQNIKKVSDALKGLSTIKGDVKISGLDSIQNKIRSIKKDIDSINKGVHPSTTGGQSGPQTGRGSRPRPYQMGDWMKDSDKPYDWHRDIDQPTQPTPKGEDETQPGRTRRRSESRLDTTVERLQKANELLDAPGKLQDVWSERLHSLEAYTEETKALAMAQQKFIALNLSDSDNLKAFEAVKRVVKDVNGLTLTEATETVTDLHTALGNLDHAIEALPTAAKYRVGVSTMLGDKFSSAQIEEQIQGGFRFLEMINAVGDKEKMNAYFNRLQQITAATGGRVTPQEMLQMAQTGGTALQGISLEGLTALTLPTIEMGGSRTGSALQTLFQQVVAGRIQQKGLEEWRRLGLLDESKIEFGKGGKLKGAQPGAVTIGGLLQKNPLAFADALRDAMQKGGVNTSDPDAVIKELGALKMPRTAMELTSLLINQRSRVEKDMDNVQRAKEIEALYGQGGNTPLGALLAAQASIENAKAIVGMPILQAQGSVATGVVKPSADYISQHPTLATWLGYGKMGFEGVSGVAQSGLIIALLAKTLFGGGAAAGGAGAAGAAAGGGAAGAAAGGGGLSAILSLLAGPAAIAALAGGSLYAVHSNYKYETEKRQRAEDDATSHLEEIRRLREQYGGRLPEDLSRGYAATAFGGVDRRGLLNELGIKTFGTPGYPGISATPYGYDSKATMAGEFARRAPELQFSEVMRAFIEDTKQRIKSGTLTEGAGSLQLEIAKQAFPDAFKQASELLSQNTQDTGRDFGQLDEVTKPLIQSYTSLSQPAERLPFLFGQAGYAAHNLATRLDNVRPTFNFDLGNSGDGKPLGLIHGPLGGNTGGRKPSSPFYFNAPSKADGGTVERGGLVHVHEREAIVPARVTARWRDEDFRSSRLEARGSYEHSNAQHYHFHEGAIVFNPPANSLAANDPQAFLRLLERVIANKLERM